MGTVTVKRRGWSPEEEHLVWYGGRLVDHLIGFLRFEASEWLSWENDLLSSREEFYCPSPNAVFGSYPSLLATTPSSARIPQTTVPYVFTPTAEFSESCYSRYFNTDPLSSALTRAVMEMLRGEGEIIHALPDEYTDRYDLLKPIWVDFDHVEPDTVVAHFREAELSATGYDEDDAQADLIAWILDMFDDLISSDPETLGALPTKQKHVLQGYLRHRR